MSDRQRSLGMPGVLPAEYPANDTSVKPVRTLPTAMCEVFAEVRDGRVWIGRGNARGSFACISLSRAEFAALVPHLRNVVTALKETP